MAVILSRGDELKAGNVAFPRPSWDPYKATPSPLYSRRCCYAPRRDNTRGILSPTIQTQSWLILIITWYHQMCCQTGVIWRHLLGDSDVDYALCLSAEVLLHTVLCNENDKFYTTMIYPCINSCICFIGIACLMKVRTLFKPEFPRVWVTWWTAHVQISNLCEAAYVNKQIRVDFRRIKLYFWWIWSTISGNNQLISTAFD